MAAATQNSLMPEQAQLRRALSLPWLVFYGVGVTVGAGIFALIGEVLAAAGDFAVWSFLLSGLVAAVTGYSYVLLSGAFPRAAGEAVFVKVGIGAAAGRLVGCAVVIVAVTSSAVIGLAFAGYLASFTGIPQPVGLLAIMALMTLVAMAGVRESVAFAGLITILEVGTLLVVAVVALPSAPLADTTARLLSFQSAGALNAIAAGAFLAFFAFIGFEDIENMAEETRDASRVVPLAIVLTLAISVVLYAFVAFVATAFPDRSALLSSDAPLALLFERSTGMSGAPVAAMASVAMVNGILVQVVMASRVLYGMANEALVPAWFGKVNAARQTPVRATLLVAAAAAVLGLSVPLLRLAELTSLVMLLIFAIVNVSLVAIGGRQGAEPRLRRWRWWGVLGAATAIALVVVQVWPDH